MSNHIEDGVKILVVEDNSNIIESLKYILEKEAFDVQIANSKKQAIENIKMNNYDLFLLDIQLPDGTGFEICKYIKSIADKPIIFISERFEESNIVYGLDIGADDYIIKPFRNSELVSRILSVLRRYRKNQIIKNEIKYGTLKVDIDKAKVYKNSKEIFLTSLEYKILLMFLNNIDKVITREELLEKIWDIDGNYVNDNTLSVYIKRLRLKISEPRNAANQTIQTVRGIGYILNK